ncbi:hypothetical protein PILCRDRAFT_507 [Piloderma croceum F 1598]|uniref:Sphingomyelin phosphodiesterase n=1 Tax=Piloderma croceum (strain F 1598) TaxID=765440 RepID=A0A0C3GL16_PILCF|nr:hypothetical protein PILCRDRAFT_507 [Piloderma croceum F 1598]
MRTQAIRSWLFFALLPSSCTARDLLAETLTAFENAVDCKSCHALLVPLKALAELGNSAFVDTIVTLCETLKLEDDDVCQGTVGEQGPIIAQDLRQISLSGQTGTLICDAVLGLCQAPAVNPHTVPIPEAAPANPKVWNSSGNAPFQVLHFSDVHIDRQYTPGSEANCTKPICCRNFADDTSTPTLPAGPNGEPKCDPPVSLADSMLEFAQQTGSSANFSIFTGDVVEAAVWLVNKSEVTNDLQDFNSEMAAKLQAPVFPSLGNHDVAPVNFFPRNTTSNASDFQWRWIGSEAASQVDHLSGSYWKMAPGMNLRIISLNTQYWYKLNLGLYDSDTLQPDPNGILAFLVESLQATEDADQRAWIIGHIAPGHVDALHDQSNYYNQIIQRYKNSIAGQFFGHSHQDQFEIAYSDYSNQQAATAIGFASLSPALTPRSGNPAFKMYDVDPDTFEVVDIKVYTTNMSDPSFQTTPTWELYYSARDTYGPLVPSLTATESLSPAFWHNLTEVFAKNESAFQIYNTFLSRDGAVVACDDTCRNTTICGLRAMRAENNCNVVMPGINFSRRHVRAPATAGRVYDLGCEGSGVGNIMQKLNVYLSSTSISSEITAALRKRLESIDSSL